MHKWLITLWDRQQQQAVIVEVLAEKIHVEPSGHLCLRDGLLHNVAIYPPGDWVGVQLSPYEK